MTSWAFLWNPSAGCPPGSWGGGWRSRGALGGVYRPLWSHRFLPGGGGTGISLGWLCGAEGEIEAQRGLVMGPGGWGLDREAQLQLWPLSLSFPGSLQPLAQPKLPARDPRLSSQPHGGPRKRQAYGSLIPKGMRVSHHLYPSPSPAGVGMGRGRVETASPLPPFPSAPAETPALRAASAGHSFPCLPWRAWDSLRPLQAPASVSPNSPNGGMYLPTVLLSYGSIALPLFRLYHITMV